MQGEVAGRTVVSYPSPMSQFRQGVPQGQPRTARSIAEGGNAPANFPDDIPYDAAAGAPAAAVSGTYKDSVQQAPPGTGQPSQTTPFTLR